MVQEDNWINGARPDKREEENMSKEDCGCDKEVMVQAEETSGHEETGGLTGRRLANGIWLIDDVVSAELCAELRSYLDENSDLYSERWGEARNVQCEYINLTDIRNAETRERLDGQVFKAVGRALAWVRREAGAGARLASDTGYCLRRIWGETRLHSDGVMGYGSPESDQIPVGSIRSMSMIVSLNSDYDEGQIRFPEQDVELRLEQGSALLFPPYWTHPHQVAAPVNGSRYTINTWICER